MRKTAVFLVAAVVGVGALTLACSKKDEQAQQTEPEREYMVLGEFVTLEDTLPRILYYEDGMVSINDRCAVRKIKLNPKMPPIYVNGQPVGFC